MSGHNLRSKFESICPGEFFFSFQKCLRTIIQNHMKILKFQKTLENYLRQPYPPCLMPEMIFQKYQISKNSIKEEFGPFFENCPKKFFLVGKLNSGSIQDWDF